MFFRKKKLSGSPNRSNERFQVTTLYFVMYYLYIRKLTQCAVASVPALRADARAVPALAVLLTPDVAGKLFAAGARPPGVAAAFARVALTMGTAVQVAQRWNKTNMWSRRVFRQSWKGDHGDGRGQPFEVKSMYRPINSAIGIGDDTNLSVLYIRDVFLYTRRRIVFVSYRLVTFFRIILNDDLSDCLIRTTKDIVVLGRFISK